MAIKISSALQCYVMGIPTMCSYNDHGCVTSVFRVNNGSEIYLRFCSTLKPDNTSNKFFNDYEKNLCKNVNVENVAVTHCGAHICFTDLCNDYNIDIKPISTYYVRINTLKNQNRMGRQAPSSSPNLSVEILLVLVTFLWVK